MYRCVGTGVVACTLKEQPQGMQFFLHFTDKLHKAAHTVKDPFGEYREQHVAHGKTS